MAVKGEKHISRAETTDKRAITVTICESLDGFCLAFNKKHWSNVTDTIRLIEELLVSYIEKVKEVKALPQSRKSLLVWDAFKAQSTPKVMDTLSSYRIEAVMVSNNMTHFQQPLDLTANPAGTSHLQDILGMSWNCLVPIR